MPTNPHYEAVRAKVIAACPELTELRNQCKVYAFGHEFGWVTFPRDGNEKTFCITWENGEFETIDITGKQFPYLIMADPINLTYILRTLQTNNVKQHAINGLINPGCTYKWNFKNDNLVNQEEYVWEALDKMLSV